MATREVMIAAIVEDRTNMNGEDGSYVDDATMRRSLQGESTEALKGQWMALSCTKEPLPPYKGRLDAPMVTVDEPKAPKITKSEAPKSIKASIDRESLLRKGEKLGLDRDGMAGLNNMELLDFVTDEPKAERGTMNGYAVKGVAVTPIMEEWTKSVSDEVTMEGMLENIRLAFLEGRHHYGNELIQAAKEAC